MNIIIVRHGQTDWNIEGRLQGITDRELNQTGLGQAEETAESLKDEKVDRILCSPLIRAKQTAEVINKYHHVPIQYEEAVRERDFGEYEGTYREEYLKVGLWNYPPEREFDKVETIPSFFKRIYQFLDECKEKYADQNIMIVAHAAVSVAVKCYFGGFPKEENLIDIRLKNSQYAIFKEAEKYQGIIEKRWEGIL